MFNVRRFGVGGINTRVDFDMSVQCLSVQQTPALAEPSLTDVSSTNILDKYQYSFPTTQPFRTFYEEASKYKDSFVSLEAKSYFLSHMIHPLSSPRSTFK